MTPEVSAGQSSSDAGTTGYLHPGYAESLAEFGKPLLLPRCGGWLLERTIPGTRRVDATYCYPLFLCRDWSQLSPDLDDLGSHLVSVTLVTDPFADLAPSDLDGLFDHVESFKAHYIADLTRPPNERVSRHHRYYARWAHRKGVSVERCDDPPALLDEWLTLYDYLSARHQIAGLRRFSPKAFREQLSVPGMIAFRAVFETKTVAIQLWYRHQDRAYSHLQTTSPAGYQIRAAYALYAYGLDCLAGDCAFAALGAAAGDAKSEDDGLLAFKRGWSTATLPVYLCGRILDTETYTQLTQLTGRSAANYFPAYRAGELL